MSRWSVLVLNALLGFRIIFGSPSVRGGLRDDQIPWGPEGTIGRGTDTPPGRGWRWNNASGSWIPPKSPSVPYPTGRFYEPGDGYRYPLYYDPGRRTYLYYPAGR